MALVISLLVVLVLWLRYFDSDGSKMGKWELIDAIRHGEKGHKKGR